MMTVAWAVEDKALFAEVQSCLEQESVQISYQQAQVSDLDAFMSNLERSQPDLVLVDVSTLGKTLPDSIGSMRAAAPGAMIVALNTTAATGPVLECFRAGADEYLFPPLAEGLRKALQRRETEHRKTESTRPGGKVVAFLSAKGGCGATTIACHAAAELARLDQKILLADFDINAGIVGFLMKCKSQYSITDAMKNVHRLDSSYWKALVSTGIAGLEIISAPITLAAKYNLIDDEIRQVLAFARKHYQCTVVDAGRGMNRSIMTVIEAADEIYLVTTPEIPALHQTKQIVQTLVSGGYKEDRIRLVLNRHTRRSELQSAEVQQMLGIPVFAILPDEYGELHEAYAQGQLLPARSDLGKCMGRLAEKLAAVREPKVKPGTSFFGALGFSAKRA